MSPCNKIEGLDYLHKLIAEKSKRLRVIEQQKDVKPLNGSNEYYSDDSNFDLLTKPEVQCLLLKRSNKFFCAECKFNSDCSKAFYHHCLNTHEKLINVKSGKILKLMYRCTKCFFITVSCKGFKTHCTYKHKCNPLEVVSAIPLSNPKAETYFKAFLETSEKNQRHHILKNYFANKKRRFCNGNNKSLRVIKNNFLLENNREVHCCQCEFRCFFVFELEQHYQQTHEQFGPERNSIDNHFNCKKCSFKSMSYKQLHFHCESHSKSNSIVMEYSHKNDSNTTINTHSNKTLRFLHCNLCTFSTTSIAAILNHWRSMHNREYPPFVVKYVQDVYNENVIEIMLPLDMVSANWANGWLNEECTGLIDNPLYHCEFCNFNCTGFKLMHTHYASAHAQAVFSTGRLNVIESDVATPVLKKLLCTQTSMFQCSQCLNYTSCFYINMVNHYKAKHKGSRLSEEELSNIIKHSNVTRCKVCPNVYGNLSMILKHYYEKHKQSLTTFSISSKNEKKMLMYICQFCQYQSPSLTAFSSHVEDHRENHLDNYEQKYILAYGCSKCRRVFRHKRFLHFHFSRVHITWTESSFNYSDFPDKYFRSFSEPQNQSYNYNLSHLPQNNEDQSIISQPCSSNQSAVENNQDFVESIINDQFNDKENKSVLNLPIKKLMCYLCNFSSETASSMQFHLKNSHNITISIAMMKKKIFNHSPKYLVSKCSFQRYAKRNPLAYKKHIENLHNEEKPYQCVHCSRQFVCEVVLRLHVRKKHKFKSSSQADYCHFVDDKKVMSTCSHVNKHYIKQEIYQSHVSSQHSKEKPFHCPRCNHIYECCSIFTLHLRKKHKLDLSKAKILKCQKPLNKIGNHLATSSKDHPMYSKELGMTGKDYLQNKSVKTLPGQWKCLECKQLLQSYAFLKRHNLKFHPNTRIIRCRWCDFICRTNVQLTNHMKIHATFIRERMKFLREICQNNRRNKILRSSHANENSNIVNDLSEPEIVNEVDHDEKMEVDKENNSNSGNSLPIELPSPINTDFKRDDSVLLQTPSFNTSAKKSIRSRFASKKSKSPTPDKQVNITTPFQATPRGTFRCKLCKFSCTEKSRIYWHLRSCHVSKKTYKCKFCVFQTNVLELVESHLITHHKMEKNHDLAVELSLTYNSSPSKPIGTDKKPSSYVPSPSLPVINPEKNLSDENNGLLNNNEKETLIESLIQTSTSKLNFVCNYCQVQLQSTYEMECHMTRHERCMMNNVGLDECELAFAKFTSY